MLEPGSVVLEGRFQIVRRLGGGGMGDVYLAEQVSLGRRVALKVLRRALNNQPGMAQRFRREAQLLSSVEHPAVVKVIDFGEAEGWHYLVMDFAEGETLEHVLARGALPVQRAVPLLAQLADGLAAIHAKGIIHRDLKPENVMLTQGPRGELARLLDFGIAKIAEAPMEAGVSQVGVVLGTPEYLSPEQASGAKLDARCDLYAFGVVAFRALAGKLPFLGPSPRQFMAQHLAAPPIPLGDAAPHLRAHPALGELVMRCLEKDPQHRPQTARALAEALAAIALDVTPTTGSRTVLPADAPRDTGAMARGPMTPTGTAQWMVERSPTGATPAPASQSSGTAAFGAVAPPMVPARTAFTGPAPAGKTRNLTLMMTDIVGFTRQTSQQTREENARMLEEHDQLLLPSFKAHGGRVLQKRGDAFLVGFESPTQAVLCGMELQDRLWRRNRVVAGGRGSPKDPLLVRVVVHAGELIVGKDGPVGEPVQVLLAVEEHAAGGEVAFTEAVYLAMNRAEVIAEERGVVRTPGRDEPLRVWRVSPAAEGPPFGGRDLQRRSKKGAARTAGLLVAGVAALSAAAAVVVPIALQGEARAVRALLEQGDAAAALSRIEQARPEPGSVEADRLRQLRAAALHRLDRHGDEWQLHRGAGRIEGSEVLTLEAALEDYGKDADATRRKLLATTPKDRVEDRLPAQDQVPAPAGWGALRLLDQLQALDADQLRPRYEAALTAESCAVRDASARRLAELGDRGSVAALERAVKAPRVKDPLVHAFDVKCGHDEAAAALRALKRRNGQ